MYILEKIGLSIEILEELSYKSDLEFSFKRSLSHFDEEKVFEEIEKVHAWYMTLPLIDNLPIDSRIKSVSSAKLKWKRHPKTYNFNRVFNDILGFRVICSSYEEVMELEANKKIRIVNLSQGKSNDDGYRGIHVYYQKDNHHYPIEIQFNTYYDRQFNDWLHDKFYKRDYDVKYGRYLREQYESGMIKSAKELEEVLEDVLSSGKEV